MPKKVSWKIKAHQKEGSIFKGKARRSLKCFETGRLHEMITPASKGNMSVFHTGAFL